MISFYNYLSSIVSISPKEWQYISSFIQVKEFKKNEIVLRPGEVEKFKYFLEEGLARKYYIDGKGREICLYFAFQNNFMDNAASFIEQSPSKCFIQTLLPTRALAIHHSDLQKIYDNTSCGDKIGRLTIEQYYLHKEVRELGLLTKSAEERYLELFKQESRLLQQISLKHISSYLGVTPQALSRIRKRII